MRKKTGTSLYRWRGYPRGWGRSEWALPANVQEVAKGKRKRLSFGLGFPRGMIHDC